MLQQIRYGIVITALISSVFTQIAFAQSSYPNKAIRLVVPFPAGGATDNIARPLQLELLATDKWNVVIDNKPGAGGNIGAEVVAKALPDGYTWLLSTDTLLTVNPHVYKNMGFKMDDLKAVTLLSSFSQTLVCNPALGVKTLSELIAKSKTQSLSYASGGAGVPGHLSMELLLNMTGMQMVHIPYKGPAPAAQDVLANQVPCGLLAGPTVLPHVRSGTLSAVAVSGQSRSPTLPDTPTISEAGVKGYDADFSLVMWAPKQVPDELLQKFRQALLDGLKLPETAERLKATDQLVIGSTPEEAAARIAKDYAKWGAVTKKIGLSLE